MHIINILLANPAFFYLVALFLSVIWMIRDEKDRLRVVLVFALTINIFYAALLHFFMSEEGAILPWKFDYILARLDVSLGIQTASIARPLQGSLHLPLAMIYNAIIPMMIAWYLLTRYRRCTGSIVLAYAAELVIGPLLYAIVPACGPIYAFGKHWLHPPAVSPVAIRLTGDANSFPSLHVGTAFVFLMFAPGRIWKAVAFLFLVATCMATLAMGEHYVTDLVPGIAFGVFVSAFGMRNYGRAGCFLALSLAWSLAVRFAYTTLLAHAALLRSFACLTLVLAAYALHEQWSQVHTHGSEQELPTESHASRL